MKFWVTVYRWGVGLRIGSHYWHLRKPRPLPPVFSEFYKIDCNSWDIGPLRLTHRWKLK